MPVSDVSVVSKAQEQQLGLKPYLVCYSPFEVLSESKDGAWYKIRTIEKISDPFGPTKTKYVWTLIDNTYVATYEAYVELTSNGKIKSTKVDVPLVSVVEHGFSQCPVRKLSISEEKFVSKQAYHSVVNHLRIENIIADTAYNAGYVQRTMKPLETGNLYEPMNENTVKSDNDHILVTPGFAFVESEGKAISTLRKTLEDVKIEIREAICLGVGSISKEALVQAAASKKMDMTDFEVNLRHYGKIITSFYQDILQMVNEIFSSSPPEAISVSGLDSFDLESLEQELNILSIIKKNKLDENLSEVAVKQLSEKISFGLNRNSTSEQKALITEDIKKTPQERK